MESKQAFGSYVKEKRQAKGLSQRDLAQKLYVTESAVSKWERGVSYPDITQITPLCEVLDVSEHELVTASDDERQRRMEREVTTHRKVRRAWLVAWSVIYLFVIVGAATTKTPLGPFPYDIAQAVVGCLLMASFTHVPVLVKSERGMAAFCSAYLCANLLMLVEYGRYGWVGLQNFSLSFVGLLFSVSVVAVPFVLVWASKRSDANALVQHKGLIYLSTVSILLMFLVSATCLRDGKILEEALRFDLIAAVMLVPVWTTFLALRYVRATLPFRLAAAIAAFGAWVFFGGGLVSVLFYGTFAASDLHTHVNFADWATYPTVNDNLCWLVLIVCLIAAAVLCVAEVALHRPADEKSEVK